MPVCFIAEGFGAQGGWDEITRTATVQSGSDTATLVIGSDMMQVGDTALPLDVAAQTMHDRTMRAACVAAQATATQAR